MSDLKHLPPEKRIKRYRAEVAYHQNKPGYASEFMLNLYKGMLAAAQNEVNNAHRQHK